jgi:hypothetical protein
MYQPMSVIMADTVILDLAGGTNSWVHMCDTTPDLAGKRNLTLHLADLTPNTCLAMCRVGLLG